jgi:hypothetical protein
MHSDYDVMIIHQQRVNALLREAREYELAKLAQGPTLTLGDRFRKLVAAINAKLYTGPAYARVDCVLLPAEC